MVPMDLFSSCDLGPYRVRNRLVMAPMTRLRCGRDGVNGIISFFYWFTTYFNRL